MAMQFSDEGGDQITMLMRAAGLDDAGVDSAFDEMFDGAGSAAAADEDEADAAPNRSGTSAPQDAIAPAAVASTVPSNGTASADAEGDSIVVVVPMESSVDDAYARYCVHFSVSVRAMVENIVQFFTLRARSANSRFAESIALPGNPPITIVCDEVRAGVFLLEISSAEDRVTLLGRQGGDAPGVFVSEVQKNEARYLPTGAINDAISDIIGLMVMRMRLAAQKPS